MRYGELATIVVWRAVSEISAIVFKPALYGAIVLFHHPGKNGHIATVKDYVVPI